MQSLCWLHMCCPSTVLRVQVLACPPSTCLVPGAGAAGGSGCPPNNEFAIKGIENCAIDTVTAPVCGSETLVLNAIASMG